MLRKIIKHIRRNECRNGRSEFYVFYSQMQKCKQYANRFLFIP